MSTGKGKDLILINLDIFILIHTSAAQSDGCIYTALLLTLLIIDNWSVDGKTEKWGPNINFLSGYLEVSNGWDGKYIISKLLISFSDPNLYFQFNLFIINSIPFLFLLYIYPIMMGYVLISKYYYRIPYHN